jgi:carbon-monoxide dehydrogenase small subunit
MAAVAMTVNGKAVTGDTDPRTLLVQYLREELRLTGTHVGCDTSQCGACVVHVNGKAVKSCTVFAWQLDGADVLTIEGLAAPNGPLHPMQEAFREHHGLQCGYYTPGMFMSAIDIANRKGHELDDETIRHELEGNLCRCISALVKARLAGPPQIIDMSKIEGLSGIEVKGRSVIIGAMTPHAEVATSPLVQQAIPALAALAARIGDPAVRHRGTIGGSVANNDPNADYPAACLGLGATS